MSLVERSTDVGVRVGALGCGRDVVLPARQSNARINVDMRTERREGTYLFLLVGSVVVVLFLDGDGPCLDLRLTIRLRERRVLNLSASEVSSPALARIRLTNAA